MGVGKGGCGGGLGRVLGWWMSDEWWVSVWERRGVGSVEPGGG